MFKSYFVDVLMKRNVRAALKNSLLAAFVVIKHSCNPSDATVIMLDDFYMSKATCKWIGCRSFPVLLMLSSIFALY